MHTSTTHAPACPVMQFCVNQALGVMPVQPAFPADAVRVHLSPFHQPEQTERAPGMDELLVAVFGA